MVSSFRERVKSELEGGASTSDEAQHSLRTLREEISRLQDRHEELRESMHGEDLSSAELKIRVEQLVQRIVDVYKVPLEFAFKQYSDSEQSLELEEKVIKLTSQLEHIGPVNPEAITEREALEERLEFLKAQMGDIDKSKVQLRKVVREIDQQIESGKPPFPAILDSGVSRMRPVLLAAATTILGLIPLLPDVFFVNMAITMMAGLGFATVLTLVVVPTLYAILFRVRT